MYLLDTHILLWWLQGDDDKLGQKITRIIASPDHEIWVSAVSIWEIVIKRAIGKLIIGDEFLPIVQESFQHLPITMEDAFAVRQLPLYHQDPFDRLLISQANLHGLTLITEDKNIWRYSVKCLALQ